MDFEKLLSSLKTEKNSLPIYNSGIIARPPIKGVQEQNVIPYLLSLAYRIAFKLDKDFAISFLNSKPSLPSINGIHREKSGLFSYYHIYEAAFNYLIDFLLHLMESSKESNLKSHYSCIVDHFQDKNRRQRQEDRYFHALNLENYVTNCPEPKTPMHPTMAFGVFDGHNGWEVAEHCSILAPYLLSKYFRMSPNDENSCQNLSVPRILANVFRQMNQSILEGAVKYPKERLWRGGSTGTICVIHSGNIYTAWVGDSQAWLVFDSPQSSVHIKNFSSNMLNSHKFVPGDVELLNGGMNLDDVIKEGEVEFDSTKCMPLTDMLHKASNAEEFVSISRRGGTVLIKKDENFKKNNNNAYNDHIIEQGNKQASKDLSRLDLESWRVNNGFIPQPEELTTGRVSGICEVSRSFGDELHFTAMHALPSMTVCSLTDIFHISQPLAIVLGSDGLWDNVGCSGPTIGRIVQQFYLSNSGLDRVSETLGRRALCKSSQDNITVVSINLSFMSNLLTKSNNNEKMTSDVDPNEFGIGRSMHLWPLGNRTASVTNVSWANNNSLRGPNLPKTSGFLFNRPHSDSFTYTNMDLGISSPIRMLELE